MISGTDPASVLAKIEMRVRTRQHTLPEIQPANENPSRFLGFHLGKTRLAVAATRVLKSPLSTRVPGAPPWLWGVAGLHGYPLPILNFAALCQCHTPGQTAGEDARVLVIHHRQSSCGLLVDSIHGLLLPNELSDTPPPGMEPGITSYLQGACYCDDTLWGVVDCARIFHRLVPMKHLEKAG